MPVLRTEGLEIAYERAGAGPPLVLLHGAGDDGRIWRPQVAALADGFTVVAWDEPGAGRSSDVPDGFALADWADSAAALIRALALGPAHVGGLSWGGTVALELCRRHPELVATLVLADTYAGWKGSLPAAEVEARLTAAEAALDASSAVATPGLFAGETPAAWVGLLDELAAAVRPRTFRAQLAAMAATDLSDALPGIGVPTLLIWGELDARSPLTVARRFERAIPDATLVVLPGAGHLSNLERPDAFTAAVRDFCLARGAW